MTAGEAQLVTGVIPLRDGRSVQWTQFGDPGGAASLWFHGAFSSRLEASLLDVPARELGVRLISLDRPGVGGSSPLSGRSVCGYADDVVQVLDALGVDRVTVGGLSNGGMYAMAIGAVIPDRVLRVVPVNSATPVADSAARAALSLTARLSYLLLERRPDLVTKRMEKVARAGRSNGPAWAANLAEVLRQPDSGYVAGEIALATRPWGFDHRAVPVPVALVSGQRDAGLGYAKVWAEELPLGRLVLVPGGHLGILAPGVAHRVVELLRGRSPGGEVAE